MTQKPTRTDRVGFEPTMHELAIKLSQGPDRQEAPFTALKDVFMLAMCLGFTKGIRRPLSGRVPNILWQTFSLQTDVPVIYAIAIADTGDVAILTENLEFLTIVEEYANEGIRMLEEYLADRRSYPLWSMVQMVLDERDTI